MLRHRPMITLSRTRCQMGILPVRVFKCFQIAPGSRPFRAQQYPSRHASVNRRELPAASGLPQPRTAAHPEKIRSGPQPPRRRDRGCPLKKRLCARIKNNVCSYSNCQVPDQSRAGRSRPAVPRCENPSHLRNQPAPAKSSPTQTDWRSGSDFQKRSFRRTRDPVALSPAGF